VTAPTFSSESTKRIIADVWGDEDALERQRANLRTRANVLAKEPAPQRAEALQLQRRTGVPWAVAELDIPEVRARDAYQQLGPVRVENSPAWASFLEGPLAPIALQNPENTRAIADAIDLRTLGAPTPSVLSAGYARGVHMTEVGKLGTRVYLDLASDADRVRFDYMRRNWPEVPDVPGYVDDVAALLAEQAPVLASIATYSATTAAGAGLVGLGSGPGAAVFAGGGAVAGAGYGSFVLEGGNAYAEFLDIAEEVFQESGEVIPHDAIRGMAMLVGVLNAGMEVGGIGLLLRITGLSRLKGRLTSEGATEIIKSKTLRPYLISFAKRMAKAMAVEGGTEGLQEVVNIAGAEILVEATTGQEVDFWSWENVERVLKAAAAGAVVGSAIQVGAAPIVLASERVALNRKTQAKEQQLDALNELVGSSELTGADLDAVRTWVQGMLEEGAGDTNLYVPAENLVELFQEDEALGEAMPGVLGQLAEALATGGDVVVPVADYVTHLNEHHETLKGVVRHGLGERSVSEVDATSAEDEAALDAEMEALAAPPIEQEIADLEARIAELEQPIEGEPPRAAEAVAEPVAEAPELAELRQQLAEKQQQAQEAAAPSRGEQAAQTVLEKLIRQGVMRPEDAQFVASLMQAHAERRAEGVAGEKAFEQLEAMEVEGPEGQVAPPTTPAEELARVDIAPLLDTLREAPETLPPEVEQLSRILDNLGIDLDQMTNEEIISELQSRFAPTTLAQPIDEAPGERQLGGVFHSSLGRALRTSQQRKMTKPQLRKFLEKSRVKKEEILWSALEEFIANKDSVNLDEALEAIHLVEVGEVMLVGGNKSGVGDRMARREYLRDQIRTIEREFPGPAERPWEEPEGGYPSDYSGLVEELRVLDTVSQPTRHEEYTLLGGENYRELLITLPRPSLDAIIEAGGTRDEYNRAVEAAGPAFEGGHYSDVPNVVVFVRFNERIDADGKRVLFIEEIQSDWHQQGREKGYYTPAAPLSAEMEAAKRDAVINQALGQVPDSVLDGGEPMSDADEWQTAMRTIRDSIDPDDVYQFAIHGDWHTTGGKTNLSREELRRDLEWAYDGHLQYVQGHDVTWTSGDHVPDAPFKTTWPDLALKRMVAYAAQNGFDSVAWTPGQVHFERWGSEEVAWVREGDHWLVSATEQRGGEAAGIDIEGEARARGILQEEQGTEVRTEAELLDMVRRVLTRDGSGQAEKVAARVWKRMQTEDAGTSLPRKDGMEIFYDRILVNAANKIGKKFGAKVGRSAISPTLEPGKMAGQAVQAWGLYDIESGYQDTEAGRFRTEEEAKAAAGPTVHTLPITDELQASVTDEGLALFQPIDEEGPRGPQPGSGGIRGSLTYDPELNQILMRFTEARNLSTALHESGHLFFVMMMQDAQTAGASPQLLADMQTALDYLGAESIEALTKEQHEVWARSFEAYLREGKAPSVELQSVFERFRLWLLQVYRTLKRLDVELSPEIREVFDRLLATDEQIALAREQERMLPAFGSAEAAGMTEAEYEAYRQSHGRRDIDAMQDMSKKILAELSRKATAEWRENFEKMRAEVEAEINAQPITKARHWLQFGTLLDEETPPELEAVKLDRDALEAIYGEPILRALPGSGGNSVWRNEGGVHPDELASVLGFTSGDALVRALVKSENRNDAIEKETTRRMKETYGDILNDGTLPELVMEAMENDAKGNFLIRQGRILARRSGVAGTPQALARRSARRIVEGKTYRQLSPHRYRLAEQRAAREVLEAVDAQDWEVANEAGRKQLLNHFLVVEATKAKDQSEKRVAALKRFTTKGVRQKIGMAGDIVVAETTGEEITEGETYLDRIDDLLDRIDLRKISAKAAARRTSLALFIANLKERATTEAIAIPAISPDLLHSLEEEDFRKPWQDLTVTELKDIADAVTSLAHVARLKNKLMKAKDQRDFAAIRDDLLASAEKNKRTDKPLAREPRHPKERKWRGIASFLAELRKVTSLLSEFDNDEPGVFHDKVLFPMDEAGHWEHAELLKAGEALVGLFDRFSGNFLSRLGTTFRLSEPDVYRTQYVEALGAEFSKEGLLMILLNLGNAGNRQRLQSGDNFTDAQIEALLNDPSVFTKEDFDWAQKVWDFVGSYWGQISDKRKRVTGVRPERVEAVPLQTRFGTYPGGYLPIDYDRMLQGPAGRGSSPDAVQDTLRQMNAGGYVSAVTRHGFEEARLAEVHGMPLRLDFGVIFEHIQGVIHDLAFHEWMIDANRIFRDPSIALSIKQGYGHDAFRVIESALKSIAVGDVASSTGMNRVLNLLRRKTSVSILGHNFRTILLQYTGLLPAMEAHGAKWIAVGSRALSSGDKTYENSTMMVNRASFRTADSNRELREAQTEFRRVGVLKKNYETVGYTGIIFTQSHVDRVVWLGVYAKEMHEGSGDEVRAYAVADRAVLETQGGGQIKDLSELQTRDATTKILTAFMSYANVLQQREAQAWRRLGRRRREGGGTRKAVGDWARFLGSTQMIFFMSELITSIVIDTLLQDWDEDKEWYEYALDNYLFNGLLALANPIPILREVTGTLRGYQYGGPASLRVVPAFGGVLVQTKQVLAKGTEELDSALAFALLDFVGTFTGFPAPATKKLIRGADYMEETGSWNPANLLFGPPRENRR